MSIIVCDGGDREWFAVRRYCRRCYGTWTHFGYSQLWYDPEVVCGHCGFRNGYYRGSAANDLAQAKRFRIGFTGWLLAGSPKLDLTPYLKEA